MFKRVLFMHTEENCLSSNSIFIFMKSLYSGHYQGQRQNRKSKSPRHFYGECLYQAISPKAKWIIQYDGVKIKLWSWWWQWFAIKEMESGINNGFLSVPPYGISLYKYDTYVSSSLWKVEYARVFPLWYHFIRVLWRAVITHSLIVCHF